MTNVDISNNECMDRSLPTLILALALVVFLPSLILNLLHGRRGAPDYEEVPCVRIISYPYACTASMVWITWLKYEPWMFQPVESLKS